MILTKFNLGGEGVATDLSERVNSDEALAAIARLTAEAVKKEGVSERDGPGGRPSTRHPRYGRNLGQSMSVTAASAMDRASPRFSFGPGNRHLWIIRYGSVAMAPLDWDIHRLHIGYL